MQLYTLRTKPGIKSALKRWTSHLRSAASQTTCLSASSKKAMRSRRARGVCEDVGRGVELDALEGCGVCGVKLASGASATYRRITLDPQRAKQIWSFMSSKPLAAQKRLLATRHEWPPEHLRPAASRHARPAWEKTA